MSSDFEPWKEFPEIWNTQAKFMAWVRGGVRLGLWKKHPVKLEFLKKSCEMIVNTNPRSMKRFPMVKAYRCSECNEMHGQTNIEVDHISGNHSLKSMDDLRSFIEAMIMVRYEDLRIVCKPCHKIKSYAEREGITFNEAKAIKKAIEICKGRKDKKFLEDRGILPASNATERRKQVEQALMEEV